MKEHFVAPPNREAPPSDARAVLPAHPPSPSALSFSSPAVATVPIRRGPPLPRRSPRLRCGSRPSARKTTSGARRSWVRCAPSCGPPSRPRSADGSRACPSPSANPSRPATCSPNSMSERSRPGSIRPPPSANRPTGSCSASPPCSVRRPSLKPSSMPSRPVHGWLRRRSARPRPCWATPGWSPPSPASSLGNWPTWGISPVRVAPWSNSKTPPLSASMPMFPKP